MRVGLIFASLALCAPLATFVDVGGQTGIHFQNEPSRTSRKYLPEAMGGGVALFDYNGDGRLDIFLVNGAALQDPMPPGVKPDKSDPKYWNRLYRNNGDGTFTDVTASSGLRGTRYGMGAAVGDYNNDGRPDLYVTNLGGNNLYRNNGDGTFTDVTEQAGVRGGGWSTGAAFVDYDRDGLLDLVVSRYLQWDFSMDIWCGDRKAGFRAYCDPDQFQPTTHLLFHNEGNGRFRDVSRESGFASHPGKGLGIAINDYDRDNWPDILIANDGVAQQLFHNLRNGKFEEAALSLGVAYDEDGKAFAGMGVDFADYDNDGWPDIFINALANQSYALFHNDVRNAKGAFEYVSGLSGLGMATRKHSGWGAKFIDYDNDGWKDLFIGQGHVMDNIQLTQPDLRYLESPLLLRNELRYNGGKFIAMPTFDQPRAARGVAFGDLDNDGSIDLVMNCNGGSAVVLRNQTSGNNWLMVNTVGSRSNRDGIGARIHLVTASGADRYGIVSTASSYLSASDKRVHFGLGADKFAKSIEITWPSGTVQRIANVSADQILTVREPVADR
ncbi:MAG: CRTAC1 family protein [Acidobacteriota bacterium]|nr:CRTAC1 family protein [Acidobacteriota bacterium]